jgi:hypothetical protein
MMVYVVQHSHEIEDGEEDIKFIGVYSGREKAQEAVARLQLQPGFKETPECFHIDSYTVDADNWKEGFLTTKPD